MRQGGGKGAIMPILVSRSLALQELQQLSHPQMLTQSPSQRKLKGGEREQEN